MSETTAIERATKAVDKALGGHDDWDAEDHRRIAVAVIEAIREPTEAMLNAGERAVKGNLHDADEYVSWRAMIDAALAEPPQSS